LQSTVLCREITEHTRTHTHKHTRVPSPITPAVHLHHSSKLVVSKLHPTNARVAISALSACIARIFFSNPLFQVCCINQQRTPWQLKRLKTPRLHLHHSSKLVVSKLYPTYARGYFRTQCLHSPYVFFQPPLPSLLHQSTTRRDDAPTTTTTTHSHSLATETSQDPPAACALYV